ncbi:MAG: hypothetical protein Q8P80_02670 [Candidatus Levybacteria bacterium]|nr:hypothetical protein [Candidatus Levybacteria bacterium]
MVLEGSKFTPSEVIHSINKTQISAINFARKLGQVIATKHPEFADKYRQGFIVRLLVGDVLLFDSALSDSTKIAAVQDALKYLINPDELKSIGKEHVLISNQRLKAENRGIFGMSEAERREASRKGGLVNGPITRDLKKGFFALSDEELQAARAKGRQTLKETGRGIYGMSPQARHEARIRSAIAQGRTLVSDEEKEYLLHLADDSNFKHQTGRNKGRSDYKLIKAEIESKFVVERTSSAYKSILYDLREKAKQK